MGRTIHYAIDTKGKKSITDKQRAKGGTSRKV